MIQSNYAGMLYNNFFPQAGDATTRMFLSEPFPFFGANNFNGMYNQHGGGFMPSNPFVNNFFSRPQDLMPRKPNMINPQTQLNPNNFQIENVKAENIKPAENGIDSNFHANMNNQFGNTVIENLKAENISSAENGIDSNFQANMNNQFGNTVIENLKAENVKSSQNAAIPDFNQPINNVSSPVNAEAPVNKTKSFGFSGMFGNFHEMNSIIGSFSGLNNYSPSVNIGAPNYSKPEPGSPPANEQSAINAPQMSTYSGIGIGFLNNNMW